MAYYFIVSIAIHDEAEYQRYIDQCDAVFAKYKGKYLAVDNAFEVIEGSSDGTRKVIIRFDTKEDFDSWYYSEDYQAILTHRLGGATCNAVLVKGIK